MRVLVCGGRKRRAPRMGPKESDVTPWILAQLGAEEKRWETKDGKPKLVSTGFYLTPDSMFWRNNTGAFRREDRFIRFGAKGSADILGIVKGRLVALEVKREGEKPSPEQKQFEAWIVARGASYAVVYSPAEALAVVEKARRRDG